MKIHTRILIKTIPAIFLASVLGFFLLTGEQKQEEEQTEYITDHPTTLTYPSYWHTPFGIHRGTAFWLRFFLGQRAKFNNPMGVACTKLLSDYGKINEGSDDCQLTAYGINSGESDIIYNPTITSLDVYGRLGKGDGEFDHPTGIACNENGDVYVADTGNNRVVRLFNDTGKLKFIRSIGSEGTEIGKFRGPTYLALDSSGRIFVTDSGNKRIQIFNKSGGFLYAIDSPNGFSDPGGICVCDDHERYTGYRNNFIYLIDSASRIVKMDMLGKILAEVKMEELLGKKVSLTTLAQDYFGNVYAVDNLNSLIYKLNPDLELVTDYGSYGTDDYQFENPVGVAIYKHYGQVIVSDRHSASYLWICSDIKDMKISRVTTEKEDTLKFDFKTTEKAYLRVEIETEKNIIVICDKLPLEIGRNTLSWPIPAEYVKQYFKPGASLPITIKVTSTYSSYPHIGKQIKEKFKF